MPARGHRGDAPHALDEKAKATTIVIRLAAGRRRSTRTRRGPTGTQRHRRLLEDLHARRLPGRPLRAADPPPALPVPPVDLRRAPTARKVIFGPAARPLPQLPITVDAEGYLVAQQRLRRAGRAQLLGAREPKHDAMARLRRAPAAGSPANWLDDRLGAANSQAQR